MIRKTPAYTGTFSCKHSVFFKLPPYTLVSSPVIQKQDYSLTYFEAFWNVNSKMIFQHTLYLLIYYCLSIQIGIER